MKRLFLIVALFSVCLPLAAQKPVVKGKDSYVWEASMGAAFKRLNAEWIELNNAQLRKDSLAMVYGDYEILFGRSLYGFRNLPCLRDNATGRYILPPATEEESKQFKKQWDKGRVPDGTLIPVRLFFFDSEKGPMADCPEEMNGCLWMDYHFFQTPDSIGQKGKLVPNKKHLTRRQHKVGVFRIENGTLKEVLSFGNLSTAHGWYGCDSPFLYCSEKWTRVEEKPKKKYDVLSWLELVEPLGGGANYYKLRTSYMHTDHYVRDEKILYRQYWENSLYDWSGRKVLDGFDDIRLDGNRFWIEKDSTWQVADLQLNPIDMPYDTLRPVTIGGFGPATLVFRDGYWGVLDSADNVLIPCNTCTALEGKAPEGIKSTVSTIFKNVSYTIWYKISMSKYLKKGEFEKEESFLARKNDPELQNQYIAAQLGGSPEMAYYKWANLNVTLYGPYDAERECFRILPLCAVPGLKEGSYYPVYWRIFELNVPIDEAAAFKDLFKEIREEAIAGAKLTIRGDVIDIDSITFTIPDTGRQYTYTR